MGRAAGESWRRVHTCAAMPCLRIACPHVAQTGTRSPTLPLAQDIVPAMPKGAPFASYFGADDSSKKKK